jgi:copper chaperone CopZ
VRSALLSVKGVTRAQVLLEGHEARVTYDPGQCQIDDLITAVGKAEGPMMANQYTAAVKE